MRLFVAVTDNDWFALHASKESVDEVNFWRPSVPQKRIEREFLSSRNQH